MATIPLPALHINPPAQQPDIAEQYGRILQLKQMMQEAPLRQQALQQQVQSGQLDLQKQQIALKDQQASSAAMQEWDGNPTALPDLLRKHGASLQTVMGAKQKILETQKQYSDIAKTDADTGSKQLEMMKQKGDMIAGAFSTVLQAPDEQLPQMIVSKAQELGQQGILDPQHVQMAAQIAQSGDPQQIRTQLSAMYKGMQANSQLMEDAKTKATIENQQLQRQQEDARQAETSNYHKQEIGIRKSQLGIEGARLNFEKAKALAGIADNGSQLTGDAYLQSLPPGMQAQVKAMANGDIAIPSASARNAQAQTLRTAVLTYDPTYTDARYKGKQDFKNKGDAQNITQLSTAMEHADRAIANSAKAGFSPAMGNRTIESPTSAAYMQDAEFLTGEVGKLVKNGVLTVDEGNKISSGLTSARQRVRDSALHETMDLLGGKTRALFQKYKTGTGQDLPVNEFFDQKSQQRLQKYGLLESGGAQSGNPAPSGGSITRYKIVNGQLVPQ